jgi:hypothetical protein
LVRVRCPSNRGNFALIGNEIGDECLFAGPDGLREPTFKLDKHLYRVQSEYSNAKKACAISPQLAAPLAMPAFRVGSAFHLS